MHPKTVQAIKEEFGYETMSDVQHAVLSGLPRSDDMLVKAKTGTGKTLAFLIPAIETLLAKRKERKPNKGLPSIVIISPTRELAMQIEAEAERLCKFHQLKTHLLVGGNHIYGQITKLNRFPADIIVGTPGRLQDMQESVAQVRDACKNAEVLILDEADILLEMGFRDAVEELLKGMRFHRQTLLFSATVSPEIRSIANIALREDFTFLDLVGEEELNVHLHVPQRYAIHNTARQPELAHRIIVSTAKNSDHKSKVIVFLPTTKLTVIYAAYLRRAGVFNLVEIHSGLTQARRTRASDKFRQMSEGVLVTSDVSARGVDYPNVTLVLQMGSPESREQYIHRIGRTGRAGKSGQSLIVLSPWERGFLDALKDMPITECEEWSAPAMTRKHHAGLLEDPIGDEERKRACRSLDVEDVHPAIMSMLGYYATKGKLCGFNKEDLPDNISHV